MKRYNNVLVTGGNGMLGQHLKLLLPGAIFPSRQEVDLTDIHLLDRCIEFHRPTMIIHAAAKVGGIIDNINNPYDFFEQNVLINTNIVKSAIRYDIPRFLALSSTCSYPDSVANYPISEDNLHDGPPSMSNFAYSYAKRALCVQIDSANKQFGTKYSYILPCNLYSEFDSLSNIKKMHFITALLYKIAIAEITKESQIEIFGTGKPLRQFMYAGDLAKVIKLIVDNEIYDSFNVAPEDSNRSIDCMTKEIISILCKNNLEIRYNTLKPDGQYRKDVCNKLMQKNIGSFKFSSFEQNIPRIYKNYVKQILAKNKETTNT